MLPVGETAPSFSVPGTDGKTVDQYRLADFTETGAVVVLFYPFDFSPVCTEELCNFRDSEWLTFTSNLDVFGISTDSAFAHRRFIQDNDLPFPLLSDNDGTVSDQYDVLADEFEGHPQVSHRAVFLVDDTNTIRYAWEGEDLTTDPDIDEVAEAVRELDCLDSATPGPSSE